MIGVIRMLKRMECHDRLDTNVEKDGYECYFKEFQCNSFLKNFNFNSFLEKEFQTERLALFLKLRGVKSN